MDLQAFACGGFTTEDKFCPPDLRHQVVSQAADYGLQVVGVLPHHQLTGGIHQPWYAMAQKHAAAARQHNHVFVPWEEHADTTTPTQGVLLVAVGEATPQTGSRNTAGLDQRLWHTVGGSLRQRLGGYKHANIWVDALTAEQVRGIVFGFDLRNWSFDTYLTDPIHKTPAVNLEHAAFVTPHAMALAPALAYDHAVVDSVHWARQISNLPGNIIYPQTFAARLQALQALGLRVNVLQGEDLKEFGALNGVAEGSVHPGCVVTVEWLGAPSSDQKPIVLVGKGVTFDSGGLSIKPANGMEDMKMDKTGAVVICGVLRALAITKAPVNAVAVVALVENMPSGTAQRPGDIVRSLSGQTIEVLNTDAEGRLILADALWYAQQTYHPEVMVDVATLTGAVRVALGPVFAGLFANDDALGDQLLHAGTVAGERLWRLPLDPAYEKAMASSCADIQNISSNGFGGGSCTAAAFLQRFVQPNVKWAHLDIAAVEHVTRDTPLCPRGGNAFGVQLLTTWIQQRIQQPAQG